MTSPSLSTPLPAQRPGRRITGMSAVLLPFLEDGEVDWPAFAAGVARTAAAGLVPAVNMDTGYGPNLDPPTRARVLSVTASTLAGAEPVQGWSFVAGAHVDDGNPAFDPDAHRAALASVAEVGGVPILFPSAGVAALPGDELPAAHAAAAGAVDRMLAFELGRQFHPRGRIWDLPTFEAILEIPQVVGAKHSSLSRQPEWERIAARDRCRPEFLVLTGNDLAIDMVRWGSDYLLGLSTMAPEAFAARDRLWEAGDARALAVDDALQALGAVAFRDPVPAYRHDAALVWHHRGWAATPNVHPASPTRPPGEQALVSTLLARLDATVAEAAP
jgi:dihydrodipicolinate synthase/N-acetylneuraminate lyase